MDAKRLTTLTANTNADLSQSVEDDPLIDGPLISQDALESEIKREFQKLPTAWVAALLTLLHVAYVAACVVLTLLCWLTDDHSEECKAALYGLDAKAVVLLGKVALWHLFFLFERFVQHHHSAARRRGHLHFYRTTRTIKRLPLLIHSAGNAAVLLILAAGSRLEQKLPELPVYLLLAVVCVELLLCVACFVVYAVRVYRFNKRSPSPDIVEEERAQACSTISHIPTETGFRDGSGLEDVVERQADLIEYLKQHNTLLSKRILELASQQIRE